MPGQPSYYFTIFKKFQVLNHVPFQTPSSHGDAANPAGGFNLNDPNAPFVASTTGTAITAGDNNKTHSPLWAILNARANLGVGAFLPVTIVGGAQAGQVWPAMPPNSPGWTEFQTSAPVTLVDVFGNWIQAGIGPDVPTGVIGQKPAAFSGPDAGFVPFVCSMPGDQGVRPGVPANYWATSLIFLTDESGNTVNPASLAASNHFFLTAVIGNRGNANGGRFLNQPHSIDVAAAVMVWNTTTSPGVELPALSNLAVGSQNGIYEQYYLRSGNYDVVGFRMDVQTVFDGIVAAVNDAVANNTLNLGGLSAHDWVTNQPAHLCAKVVIREHGTSFPNYGDTPEQDRRLAQKNLAPFDIHIVEGPNPSIIWKNFIVGQPIFLKIAGAGANRLSVFADLPEDAFRLNVAIPRVTFEKYFAKNAGDAFKGFRMISHREICGGNQGDRAIPFPEAVVLQVTTNKENFIHLPALEEKEFLAMSLGVEYDKTKLKHGQGGDINFFHRTVFPIMKPGTRCFDLEERVAGGFTLRVRAEDPHIGPNGRRIDFPDPSENR